MLFVLLGLTAVSAAVVWGVSRADEPPLPAPAVMAATPVAHGRWMLAFRDEFDGSALDAGKWRSGRFGDSSDADAPYNPGREGAYFSSSAVQVSGGRLSLTLRPSVRTIDGVTYTYAGGEVNTNGRFFLTPGMYVEARVKVPRCDGCWPAFWAVPAAQYPPELDVFEYFDTSVASHSRPSFNFHPVGGGATGPSPYGHLNVDYRDGYHVYAMYWTGSSAVPYLDGVPYDLGVRPTTTVPEYLILNLSMYAGRTPPSGSRMSVDWVRVWKPASGPR
ncbi:MAG TPA: glycoside hydrolase family 16 protein [Actinomycetales bacterium]|nr:glycoside hydrolase family 16 protein [Actinomycetales bacterium]